MWILGVDVAQMRQIGGHTGTTFGELSVGIQTELSAVETDVRLQGGGTVNSGGQVLGGDVVLEVFEDRMEAEQTVQPDGRIGEGCGPPEGSC